MSHVIQEHTPPGYNPNGNFIRSDNACEIRIGLHTNAGFFFSGNSVRCQHQNPNECNACGPILALQNEPCEDDGDPSAYLERLYDNGFYFFGWKGANPNDFQIPSDDSICSCH